MGIFSGLGGLGGMSLYETPEDREEVRVAQIDTEESIAKEIPFLLEKSFKCQVCGKDFKNLVLKTGKAKLIRTEKDLRAIYDGIEPLKYDVISCPFCSNTALSRYWGTMTDMQSKNVRQVLSRPTKKYDGPTYSYDDAIERYQKALEIATAKPAKASELAYINLKIGWLMRAKADAIEALSTFSAGRELDLLADEESKYLKDALDGFVAARQKESSPICGMDEITFDYLLAALSLKFELYEQAAKLIGNILASRTASSRIKDKARELKDEIIGQ